MTEKFDFDLDFDLDVDLDVDVDVDVDLDLEKLFQEYEQEQYKLDTLFMSFDLVIDLQDLTETLNNKMHLLLTLKHENINHQYLIELFLAETLSLFEGFLYSFLNACSSRLKLFNFEKDTQIIKGITKKLNLKERKTKTSQEVIEDSEQLLRYFLSRNGRKTLNNLFRCHNIFKFLLDLNFEIPESELVTEEFWEKCIQIRNAHIHMNGKSKVSKVSLAQVNELMGFYIKYIENLNSCVLKKLDELETKVIPPLNKCSIK